MTSRLDKSDVICPSSVSVESLDRQIDSLFGRWETSTSELSQRRRVGLGRGGRTNPRISPGSYDVMVSREFLTSASSTAATEAMNTLLLQGAAARGVMGWKMHAMYAQTSSNIHNVPNANKKLVNYCHYCHGLRT